jgi:glycosyltransferase involved in cell wall biosynthesis
MRVLAVSPTFFPIVGGAELLIRDVLNVWSEQHEVRLLTPHLDPASAPAWTDDGTLEASCRFPVRRFDDRVNLLRLRGHRATRGMLPPMSLSAVNELVREARRSPPDMMVGFLGVPFGLSLAATSAVTGVPYTLVHCGNDLPSPRTAPVPLWRRWQRLSAGRARRVVYVSRYCFDTLGAGDFSAAHDAVIHGGIPLLQPASEAAARAVRARLGLRDDDVLLFALQRLGPEKRVDVVLRAFAALPPQDRRVRLVIGGEGSESASLKALAIRLGVADDVVFAGHLGAEKEAYYRACDVFVFHSLFETFGQVLVEAMRAGRPIVSVRAGAIPEVVDDGVTGLLTEPLDPAAMATAIAALVRDPERRVAMGAEGRRRVERLFDWDRVRAQWTAVLGEKAAGESA